MNRLLAAMLAAASLLLAASPTRASVELDVFVNVRFSENCSQTSGYWGGWNATREDRDDLFAAYPPEPVTWSPTRPIIGHFVGGPSQVGDDFRLVLFAPDQTTVVFERPFDLVNTGQGVYWSVDVVLECSTVPYSELSQPDTAMPLSTPRSDPWGLILVLTAPFYLAWRFLTPRRRPTE